MSQKTAIPVLILLLLIVLPLSVRSQSNTPPDSAIAEVALERAPTSAEVMRERISKAKAMLAVRNFGAALYELENIRRENAEPSVNRVVNVLLMHAYLELSDYPKAQNLLKEMHGSKVSDSASDYLAAAGQVVNCAKSQADRYKSLGLNINDRNLPTVAVADIEGMRATLELVIEQSKEITAQSEYRSNAAALIEETSAARGNIARDAYDARRWKDQVADAREQMISGRSVVLSATTPPEKSDKEAEVAASRIANDGSGIDRADPSEKESAGKPADDEVAENLPEKTPVYVPNTNKPSTDSGAKTDPSGTRKENPGAGNEVPANSVSEKKPDPGRKAGTGTDATGRPVRIIGSAKNDGSPKTDGGDQPNVRSSLSKEVVSEKQNYADDAQPLPLGSLIGYATRRVSPVYPRQARSLRLTGVVTLKILVDEEGSVAEIADSDGPALLTRAAEDAVRKWKFRPFVRDGQPVKATGFVSFNFDL